MVLSLTLLGIVTISVGSAVLFAGQAKPAADSAAATLVIDSRALSRIAEDLAVARYVTEQTANAITIVVDDRTGDAVPDRIRYAWSGTSGTALTVQLNDGDPAAVLTSVEHFSLNYSTTTRTVTIPATYGFAPESVIAAIDTVDGTTDNDITATTGTGQLITPQLSAGSNGFMPTRLEVYGKMKAPKSGLVTVELRDQNGNEPGATLYASGTLDENDLTGAFAWSEILLATDQLIVPNGEPVALSLLHNSGSGIAAILASGSDDGGDSDDRLLTWTSGSWSDDDENALYYRLYGQEVVQSGSDTEVYRDHIESIAVSVQSTADDRSPLTREVRLLQAPEVLDQFWETDFSAAPTLINLNGDATNDWAYGAGGTIPVGSLIDGEWHANDSLAVAPSSQISAVTCVELRAWSSGVSECVIIGPLHVDASGDVMPVLVKLRPDGAGGQELVFYNDFVGETPYGTVGGLDAGWVDVKILVVPDNDTIALWVDGEMVGAATFAREPDQGLRGVTFAGQGSNSLFTQARVTVGGTSSAAGSGGGTLLEEGDKDASQLNTLLKSLFN